MTAWIFQGTPDLFDVAGYVQAVTEARWNANQHADKMKIGDTVYIWQCKGKSGKKSGIVGVAKITAAPFSLPDDEASFPFYADQTVAETEAARVTRKVALRVTETCALDGGLLDTEWLKKDPICKDLPNLRFHQLTNYPLEERHALRLAELWSEACARAIAPFMAEAAEIQPKYGPDGIRRLVTHLRIDRNRRVVRDAKAIWFNNDPDMRCCVCGFSFRETYGDLGNECIHAHHRDPLGHSSESRVPDPSDFEPVCANCHWMLHRDDSLTPSVLRLRLQELQTARRGGSE